MNKTHLRVELGEQQADLLEDCPCSCDRIDVGRV